MPKVWDLSTEEAEAALRAAGIEYRISRAQSRAIPDGDLVSVAPVPGTVIRPGDDVLLTVSSGPPVVSDER